LNHNYSSQTTSRFVRLMLRVGSPGHLDPKERQRRIPVVLTLILAALTMLAFTPYHLYSGNFRIVLGDSVVFLSSLLGLSFLKRMEHGRFVYWLIGFVFILFGSMTVLIGRTEISYFFWAFVMPPVLFFVLGKKGGLVMNLLFFVITILIITAPEHILISKPYSVFEIIRYIAIHLILTFILYYYEMSQELLIMFLQKEKEKFEYASNHDPLTGLSNRRNMLATLENEQERQQRAEERRQQRIGDPFTLVMGDIDRFKMFNDTHGHDSGDYILMAVAQILKSQLRRIDCIARWGGEEFLILLTSTDATEAHKIIERIRKTIEESVFTFNGITLSVTITFGLSAFTGNKDTVEKCIKRADEALYTGKQQGRNRVITG